MNDVYTQFKDAMRISGITPPDNIVADGEIQRFPTAGKKSDLAGWYVLRNNYPYPHGGVFGDWRTGVRQNWRADIGRSLSPKEESEYQLRMAELHSKIEIEKSIRHANAAKKAETIWEKSVPVIDDHPYLKKKRVRGIGIRAYGKDLVIPLSKDGILHSLQFIPHDGRAKQFLAGGRKKGCYFSIGNKPDKVLCICEGYATGATIYEATGYPVAVAFDAGNLESVATALRIKFPHIKLIICADDDIKIKDNTGLTKVRKAALAVTGFLAVPDFGDNRPEGMSDFNDLYILQGSEVIKRLIETSKLQLKDEPMEMDNSIKKIETKVELICATELEPEPIQWVWEGWLAAGKFHILAGPPRTGKTTIALNLAAIISQGGIWPDGTKCESGKVLIWSGEDDSKDTLLPRLLAHEADRNNIFFVNEINENNKSRSFDPSRDIPKLYEEALKIGNVRLIIIDPVVNMVSGDSHKNCEVRRDLQPLVELAEKLKAVILGISHFSKGTVGREPLERVTGSIAFGALARIVLATAKITDESGQEMRVFVRVKSNIGPDGNGYNYDLKPIELPGQKGIISSQVVWGDPIEGNARELLVDTQGHSSAEERSIITEAMDFLRVLLSEGPMLAKEIMQRAKEVGFKDATIRRAKKRLGIEAFHERYGKGSVWKWSLPSKMLKGDKDAHSNCKSTFGNNEHLWRALLAKHPSIVEDCALLDILSHAEDEDFESLMDFKVLSIMARSLRDSGKVKKVEVENEK